MLPIRLVLTDPSLRIAGMVMVLQGAGACTIGPYFSTLAVTTYGFGDWGYAVLLALSSLMAVTAAVMAGIRADQTANRRGIVLSAICCQVAGTLLMTVVPGPWVFALTMTILFPLAAVNFGQVFALARLAASAYPPGDRDAIMAVVRALFAAPFVIVLPLWSWAFAQGATVLMVYPAGLALAALMLVLAAWLWPRDGHAGWEDRPSGLNLRAALAEMAALPVTARVVALGGVTAASTVYIALVSLLMVAEVGRGPADVALYVGLVAGLEVPFMLLLPPLTARMARPRLILAGAAIYAVHVALLPVLAGSPLVWALVLPAAIGGAITLTVPIAYLQDLLRDRPGTGAALMAVQRLAGDVLAAAAFAVGTFLGGYGLVATLGVAVSLLGALALVRADRTALARPA